jgi:hypothetical protein
MKVSRTHYIILAVVVVIALAAGGYVLQRHHTQSASSHAAKNSCNAKQFGPGSSGSCVSDIQTMVNFMETDELTECPFAGAQTLSPSGSYDKTTQAEVKVVQTWLNCYDREEGTPKTLSANGTVGSATWYELCTFAYEYPQRANSSPSPYWQAAQVAGKNAGC